MGHSGYICPDCGSMVPDCDCCESEAGHYCTAEDYHHARFEGSRLAMSRFLVWVELEAQATRKQHVYCDDTYDWREHYFWMALCKGRFRLVWP